MPTILPVQRPTDAQLANHVFIACTLADPDPATGWRQPNTIYADAAPVVLMGWPIERVNSVDGSVTTLLPTPENVEERIAKEALQVKSWRIVRYDDIPTERHFRDALRDDGEKLHHDLDHAKEIALKYIREDREPELAKLDIQYSKATGQKDAKKADAVEAQRQALRDKPATVLAQMKDATTIADIHAVLIG
jgi:hypothetical protein